MVSPTRFSELRQRCPVLVVDDNHINQTIAMRQLQAHGFRVEVAADGYEAIKKFKRMPFAAILMDVQMPGLDGYETTAAMREIEKANGGRIPIIAMTAHAMKEDRERCLAAGMDGYLSKPVRGEQLIDLIEKVTSHGQPAAARSLAPTKTLGKQSDPPSVAP